MRTIVSRRGFTFYTIRAVFAAALLAPLGFAITILAFPPPGTDGRVTHTVNGNTETWRIDEPNVKKKIIEFPEIRFQAGDKVRVTGGGCVQTGGWGKTWKRYVDPLGPKSDKLYHGMVLIPGAIGRLPATDLDRFARILIIKGHEFTVTGITEPRKQHLWLGYEDDHYGDNGYSGQDAGTQGQCRIGDSWVEHAFVFVTVTHGAAPPTTGNLAPFDIAINSVTPGSAPVDDNFILLNPMWGRQITNHELPDHNQCAEETTLGPARPAHGGPRQSLQLRDARHRRWTSQLGRGHLRGDDLLERQVELDRRRRLQLPARAAGRRGNDRREQDQGRPESKEHEARVLFGRDDRPLRNAVVGRLPQGGRLGQLQRRQRHGRRGGWKRGRVRDRERTDRPRLPAHLCERDPPGLGDGDPSQE
jgi:hypothetical protein